MENLSFRSTSWYKKQGFFVLNGVDFVLGRIRRKKYDEKEQTFLYTENIFVIYYISTSRRKKFAKRQKKPPAWNQKKTEFFGCASGGIKIFHFIFTSRENKEARPVPLGVSGK